MSTDVTETHVTNGNETSFADFGKEMWSFLTGKGAAINYTFDDMLVEVPRETGEDAPRAVWRLHGTLRITTSDEDNGGRAS
jgi:hypothetical protein